MWKDFFYFSKSERRAILFLLTLLFIFMCIWVLFPVKEESLEQDQEGIEEIKNFLAGVHEMEERRCVKMHTFIILRTKPRLSQAGALLLPKDFVSLGIRFSL